MSMYYNDSGERTTYKLFWLDDSIDDQADLEVNLCRIIPLMKRFDNHEECEKEIRNVHDCTIVLIISASMSNVFIRLIHDLQYVTKIFIYSPYTVDIDFEILLKNYSKVKLKHEQ